MPVMATVVTEYSNAENARTYSISGHTVAKPKLLLQKRKIGVVGGASSTDTVEILFGTQDANGTTLPGRISFFLTCRRPVEAIAADVTAAVSVLKDVVGSDEFANMINTQNYLK